MPGKVVLMRRRIQSGVFLLPAVPRAKARTTQMGTDVHAEARTVSHEGGGE